MRAASSLLAAMSITVAACQVTLVNSNDASSGGDATPPPDGASNDAADAAASDAAGDDAIVAVDTDTTDDTGAAGDDANGDDTGAGDDTSIGPTSGCYVEITTRYRHVCVRATDGSAWCWGGNYSGEDGSGDTTSPLTSPTKVIRLASLTHVSARGQDHSCATDASHTAWCWGRNGMEQVGVRGSTAELVPGRSRGCRRRARRGPRSSARRKPSVSWGMMGILRLVCGRRGCSVRAEERGRRLGAERSGGAARRATVRRLPRIKKVFVNFCGRILQGRRDRLSLQGRLDRLSS